MTVLADEGHKFTCLACHVAFHSADHQRQHYRTDWHRYNLKRKVAELAPADEAQAQALYAGECRICGKTFASENAYAHHMRSKKHRETEQRQEDAKMTVIDEDGMVDETASPEEVMRAIDEHIAQAPKLDDEDCLFCTHKSDSFESNMAHMAKQHSLFIPDTDYLVNLRGLIRYLGEKISVGNVCLYCNGRGRNMRSMEAVRRHMIDKGHTKIAYDTERDVLELADFYDFRPSYPDNAERGGQENEDEDEEMPMIGADSAIVDEGYELVLPSGARIGHRALRRYYQQHIRQEDNRESVRVHKLLTQHGHQGAHRANAECRALQLMSEFQRRQVFSHQESRRRSDFRTRVGIKANGLQRYFREQVLY
ncbi:C2H2 type zinc-finger-domain-containing protein [Syncephalis pseudoplumigaleata]|uniref:C2H2 type zinc-finger-domain-containing protein n=1 Tax=Syncephalis pseudoplumigaleata TaxID=1712513 RepID=A0A4P9YYC9_9FUNG|nr:C2H2 type zinc-finger-domain-containing protein [Syncephalis pseudoplumigaleata]|eukprot:RKP25097.1 C2H2 type zinc-finger-domain-containing protein [Syncephalis pseudoplumigaleata]